MRTSHVFDLVSVHFYHGHANATTTILHSARCLEAHGRNGTLLVGEYGAARSAGAAGLRFVRDVLDATRAVGGLALFWAWEFAAQCDTLSIWPATDSDVLNVLREGVGANRSSPANRTVRGARGAGPACG